MKKTTIDRRNAIKKTAMLMGFAVSSSAITSILNGCKADPNAVANGLQNWKPQFLTKEEGQLVAQIAECIIPKTNTPGAIDSGAYSFIDIYLKDNTEKAIQSKFKEGLKMLETACENSFGKSFLDCNETERIELLKKEEAEAIEKTKSDQSKYTFWFSIKELTFLGYFTSEIGSKQFLKYDPIPGNYDACIPLEEVGGTWYTL